MLESNLQPSFQDDRDVREWFKRAACKLKRGGGFNISIATVDEHLQTIGAESFAKFERSVVGSPPIISRSPAILMAAKRMQEHGQF